MSTWKKALYGIVAFLSMVVAFWCAAPLLMGVIHMGMVLPMLYALALTFYCLLSLKYPIEDIPWKNQQDAEYKAEVAMARCGVRNKKRSLRMPVIFGVKKDRLESFDEDYDMRATPGLVFSREARVKIDRVVWIITGLLAIVVIAVSVLIYTGADKFDGNYEGQTIVTLGAKIEGDRPSVSLERRLDKTAELMKEYPEAQCIVTGGQGRNEIMPESSVMARYLEEQGIDKNRIHEENKAVNTEENMKLSVELAEKEGLSTDFITVTDGYHQYRVSRYADKYGATTEGESVKTMQGLWLSSHFREVMAFFKTL